MAFINKLNPITYNPDLNAADKVMLQTANTKGGKSIIVLLDINVPEIDGFATTEWIRDHYPEIKVLALSTMDAEAAIIRMIKSGERGYMLKDAEPAEIKLAYDKVLSLSYFYKDLIPERYWGL